MKNNMAEVDANFKIDTNIAKADIVFHNVRNAPFQTYGLIYEDGQYRRLPEAVARSVSDGVHTLHNCTAGGRVRFKTDSPYVAISAKMISVGQMPHYALSGSAGFDLYVTGESREQRFAGTYLPFLNEAQDGFEGVIDFWKSEEKEITVNFPPYSRVAALYIGISNAATLSEPTPYTIKQPVVYYGSSITQGACASRPGNTYQSIISRRFDCDFLNLGFSGNALGESGIADYIAGLDMSAFVLDYDHNAPSADHLKNTHTAMFQTVRQAHPTLPIVIMSRPKRYLNREEQQRRQIIEETYQAAKAQGDDHVYFIDNTALTQLCADEGTVDNTHPNDWGFYSIAHALENVLSDIFVKVAR